MMAQTQVDNMVTEITFEPDEIKSIPAGQHGGADDIARLREILRPLISDLLVEEYDTVRRMMGR
jgi:hypothetical protein